MQSSNVTGSPLARGTITSDPGPRCRTTSSDITGAASVPRRAELVIVVLDTENMGDQMTVCDGEAPATRHHLPRRGLWTLRDRRSVGRDQPVVAVVAGVQHVAPPSRRVGEEDEPLAVRADPLDRLVQVER